MSQDNWQHRNSNMRCKTCMWYVEKRRLSQESGLDSVGRCRRHAPTMNGWPVIFATDWCGDHKIDEEKI